MTYHSLRQPRLWSRAGAAGLAVVVTASLGLPATAASSSPATHRGHDERASAATLSGKPPIVIGHRGAPGYRPEHTLASYKLAIQMGADYIEPDVVSTKDGVLVARHENLITDTTDVADHPEFADRYTTKTVDGDDLTGWFVEDFTLAELNTLRAKERLPDVRPANTRYNGRFKVPTLDQILAMVKRKSEQNHRRIGVYIETKHPTYFRSIGLRLDNRLLRDLREGGWGGPHAKVYLQSFETGNLRFLDRKSHFRLVQLIDSSGAPYNLEAAGNPTTYADLVTPAGLRRIATYADGIGPNKDLLITRDADGFLDEVTAVVARAHNNGLVVHPFTFRDENQFLPADYRIGDDPNAKGDAFAEYDAFFDLGIDGLFSDFTDTAVAARAFYFDMPLPRTG